MIARVAKDRALRKVSVKLLDCEPGTNMDTAVEALGTVLGSAYASGNERRRTGRA